MPKNYSKRLKKHFRILVNRYIFKQRTKKRYYFNRLDSMPEEYKTTNEAYQRTIKADVFLKDHWMPDKYEG